MSKKCIYCIVFVCDLYRKTECTSWETIGYNHINLHQNIFFLQIKEKTIYLLTFFFLPRRDALKYYLKLCDTKYDVLLLDELHVFTNYVHIWNIYKFS